MTTQQPVAMKLAEMLTADEWPGSVTLVSYAQECVAELLTQHARITELESQLAQRFDAADMAPAAAQGFRDGVASVTNNRPSLEEVFRGLSNRAYCNYIEQMGSDVCLGWEYKSRHGMFGEAELKGHTLAGEMLGRHKAFDEAARAAIDSYPPPALEGWKWVPIEPTDAMWNAMMDWGTKKSEWLAILAAAPGPLMERAMSDMQCPYCAQREVSQ